MTIQIVKKLLKCYEDIFREINEPLKHLFHLSQEDGIFLEKAEIAKATQLFKNRNPENIKTTAQYLFFLAFLLCSSMSCITGYRNNYAKKIYYTQSILDSKKVIIQTMLLLISLIKYNSP